MIGVSADVRIVVCATPIDFRKGMDALAALIQQTLKADPFAGDVFVFRSRRADRIRALYWDGSGLVLWSKRLETGGFVWPAACEGVVRLTSAQFALLAEGLDWSRVQPRAVRRPKVAC